ncbi:MAG: tetratricopeptide repeat protein [Candidatus Schekmanbacteria bacterium]|nr:tetratricopeptide repeat protein [Candidatus Schekmanbacteria bacterium]
MAAADRHPSPPSESSESAEASRSPAVPERLGPYLIEQVVGRGGMGVVFQGRHAQTGELAAIKAVTAVAASHLENLRQEIRALARVRHPGVVRVVDQGITEGIPWFAMELVPGQTLRQHCRALGLDWSEDEALAFSMRTPPETYRTLLTILRRVCRVLAYLHGLGIVHGDVKPDNILLTAHETPVLVDFGLGIFGCERLGRDILRIRQTLEGSAWYVSPEQIRDEVIDARTDLYSLGIVMYEIFTGTPPFPGPTVLAVTTAKLEADPPAPSAIVDDFPPGLERLILNLLAREPSQRIGFADLVAGELARLGAKKGVWAASHVAHPYVYRSRLIGRQAEARALLDHADAHARGAGRVVLVGGAAGTGKTRMVMDFGQALAHRGTLVLSGQCLDGARTSLGAFRGPAQRIADLCLEGGRMYAAQLLGYRGPILARYLPVLAGLVDREDEPEEVVPLPAEAERLRLFGALLEVLAALARARPLLIIIDDLQWADELSVEFLEFLTRRDALARHCVLIVGTYRTAEAGPSFAAFARAPGQARIELGALERSAVADILCDMLASRQLPRRLVESIYRLSEGNPLCLVEYVRSGVEQAFLWRDEAGAWQFAETIAVSPNAQGLDATPLPASLDHLLEWRLSAVPKEARRLLNALAVCGREAPLAWLRALLAGRGEELDGAVECLVQRRIADIGSGEQLCFCHDQLRETAYSRIPLPERRAWHAALARHLSAQRADDESERAGVLARHWELAGELNEARACYLRAARLDVASFAVTDAEAHYRAYMRLGRGPTAASVAAHAELALSVLRPLGRLQDARAEAALGLDQARALGDDRLTASAVRVLAVVLQLCGDYDGAEQFFREALRMLHARGDARLEGLTLANVATLAHERGQLEKAQRLYRRALASHKSAVDEQTEGTTLANFASLQHDRGRLTKAVELYENAVALQRQMGQRRPEGITLGNLAAVRYLQGWVDDAARLAEQSLAITSAIGDRPAQGVGLIQLASIRRAQGRLDEALDLANQALQLHRAAENERYQAAALSELGNIRARQGKLEEARAALESCLELRRRLRLGEEEGETLADLGALYETCGHPAKALAQLDLAIRALRAGHRLAGVEHAAALRSRARLLRRLGRFGAAEADLEGAERKLRKIGAMLELGLCSCEQAHLALARQQPTERKWLTAKRIARQLRRPPECALRGAIAALSAARSAYEAGGREELFRGELLASLPRLLQERLARAGKLPQAASDALPGLEPASGDS